MGKLRSPKNPRERTSMKFSNLPYRSRLWLPLSPTPKKSTTQHGIRRQLMISIVGCFEPLGIQAGEFNDGEIAASSMSKNFSSTDAWCPPKVDENQYIQVDLSRKTELTKIATQGESGSKDRFVKTFSLLYSDNGKKWEQYGDKGAEKVRGKQDHAKKKWWFLSVFVLIN